MKNYAKKHLTTSLTQNKTIFLAIIVMTILVSSHLLAPYADAQTVVINPAGTTSPGKNHVNDKDSSSNDKPLKIEPGLFFSNNQIGWSTVSSDTKGSTTITKVDGGVTVQKGSDRKFIAFGGTVRHMFFGSDNYLLLLGSNTAFNQHTVSLVDLSGPISTKRILSTDTIGSNISPPHIQYSLGTGSAFLIYAPTGIPGRELTGLGIYNSENGEFVCGGIPAFKPTGNILPPQFNSTKIENGKIDISKFNTDSPGEIRGEATSNQVKIHYSSNNKSKIKSCDILTKNEENNAKIPKTGGNSSVVPTIIPQTPSNPVLSNDPHRVTVKITRVIEIDDPDGWGKGDGDYYSRIIIDGKKKVSKQITGEDFRPNWTFTQNIPASKKTVSISMELWDSDWFSDDHMDISPRKTTTNLHLNYDLVTKKWAGAVSFPQNSAQGDGKNKSKIFFEITSTSPDSDRDGIPDNNDKCGLQKGPKSNNGCPISLPPPKIPTSVTVDSDPGRKDGGLDPIVFGKWSYIEPGNDSECSNSPNPFDYDNDGFKEHMCYWYSPETKILFVDFDGNRQLDNGYELLNVDRYGNALELLNLFPELCVYSDCYTWKDQNSNIRVDEGEIKQIKQSFNLSGVTAYPKGKLSHDVYLPDGREREYFVYGEAEDEDLGIMYATKPTYWMKGI